MIDSRLVEADATKLDELRSIISEQENAEMLCDIAMKDISIEHGALKKVVDSVKSLTDGKKVLMVTGPTEIVDIDGNNVKEAAYALLKQ